jgi:hypothetical protein
VVVPILLLATLIPPLRPLSRQPIGVVSKAPEGASLCYDDK